MRFLEFSLALTPEEVSVVTQVAYAVVPCRTPLKNSTIFEDESGERVQ